MACARPCGLTGATVLEEAEVPESVTRHKYSDRQWLREVASGRECMVHESQGCAICGAAVMDMALHADFHGTLDTMERTLSDTSADASEALEKAEQASNILYQRGID